MSKTKRKIHKHKHRCRRKKCPTRRNKRRHSARSHKARRHRTNRRQRLRHRAHTYKGGFKYVQGGGKKTPGLSNSGSWLSNATWRKRNTFTPQPLVNVWRSAMKGGQDLVTGWSGLPQHNSPWPSIQPNLLKPNKPYIPPNLLAMNMNAQKQVGAI